jgi:hypothetical protein
MNFDKTKAIRPISVIFDEMFDSGITIHREPKRPPVRAFAARYLELLQKIVKKLIEGSSSTKSPGSQPLG